MLNILIASEVLGPRHFAFERKCRKDTDDVIANFLKFIFIRIVPIEQGCIQFLKPAVDVIIVIFIGLFPRPPIVPLGNGTVERKVRQTINLISVFRTTFF